MLDNLELFEFCLDNKESYVDKYYSKVNKPIILKDRNELNDLMKANREITENISSFKVAKETGDREGVERSLKNIIKALSVKGANFTEFSSYWAVKDISFSLYKKILKTDALKMEFLENVIPEYIKERHDLYLSHGYSFSSLQAASDAKAHKQNANAGRVKVSQILNSYGFSHFDSRDIDLFDRADKVYIYPDGEDKQLFKEILVRYNLKFDWSRDHQNKQTDFLFKVAGKIFIMEHKHMKEGGGGQGKQVTEIINFVSYKEEGVQYISFLDGVYFNLLADKNITRGKTFEQRKKIRENLEENKGNYFVNTEGFKKLIASFI
jgi:hypothetical protein